jgi:hypothetical protein
VGFGNDVTMAFDGSLLDRPSREQPVREALLVQYFGVYAPSPAVPVLNGDQSRNVEPLSYKLVRASKVIAQLIGPDGVAHVLEADVSHPAGVYPETFDEFNAEGTWHWRVQATDDLGRLSTTDRSFRYDTTLHALAVPKLAQGRLAVRFTLSRDAKVRLRVETQGGLTMRDQPAASLARGPQQLVWDGRLARGTRAYAGSYLAHLFVTSDVGTSELIVPFGFRR